MSDAQNYEITKILLAEILKHFSSDHRTKTQTMAFVAGKLRRLAPGKSWSWNYLHQIDSGTLEPRTDISNAIQSLYKEITTGKKILVPIEVMGYSTELIPFTIVTGSCKTCARTGCDRTFIPNSPNQRYCTPMCRRIDNQQKGLKK